MRTVSLHMLGDSERIEVLQDLLPYVAEDGAILVADERKNISSFQAVFDGSERERTALHAKRGILFVRRTG